MIRALCADASLSLTPLSMSHFSSPFFSICTSLSLSPSLSLPLHLSLSLSSSLCLSVSLSSSSSFMQVTRAKGTDKQSLLLQMGKVGEEVDTALKKMRVMQVCVVSRSHYGL
jgi:hypothetical protein